MTDELRTEEQLRLARSMVKSGNRWGAKTLLNSILDNRPDHAVARFELSELLMSDGSIDLALVHAAFAYELKSEIPGLARHTGDLYFLVGMYDRAGDCYRTALGREEGDSQTEERLAVCNEFSNQLMKSDLKH